MFPVIIKELMVEHVEAPGPKHKHCKGVFRGIKRKKTGKLIDISPTQRLPLSRGDHVEPMKLPTALPILDRYPAKNEVFCW